MPGWFILGLIAAGLAVLAFIGSRILKPVLKKDTQNKDAKQAYGALKTATVVLTVTFVLCNLFSSVTIVGTKQDGIVTSLGAPAGSLSNGFHMVLPWEEVTEFDATVQTDSHSGTDQNDSTPCTTVRIAHQSTACVDNSVRWQITQDAADELYANYKDFENVRNSLVTRELGAAMNEVFKDYDPLATDTEGNSTTPSVDELSKRVTEKLTGKAGNQIIILNVIISVVHLDGSTQDRLNALNLEVANTRIAKQKQQTADAEAAANGKLAGSVSHDPNVLVSKCLDVLGQMVKDKQPVPAGFSCWPGGSSSVVVPATK